MARRNAATNTAFLISNQVPSLKPLTHHHAATRIGRGERLNAETSAMIAARAAWGTERGSDGSKATNLTVRTSTYHHPALHTMKAPPATGQAT